MFSIFSLKEIYWKYAAFCALTWICGFPIVECQTFWWWGIAEYLRSYKLSANISICHLIFGEHNAAIGLVSKSSAQVNCRRPIYHLVRLDVLEPHLGGKAYLWHPGPLFSATRRSRSDESHSLTDWVSNWTLALTLLMWPWWVMIPIEDFTDVILMTLMKVIYWWKLSSDESHLVMKVI